MINKGIISAALLLSVLTVNTNLRAFYTGDIRKVRVKGVLETRDFETIDRFVERAVNALITTQDFSSICQIRRTILQYSNSNEASARQQYRDQFLRSAHQYIAAALQTASTLKPKQKRFGILTNLLILIDEIGQLQLAELAIPMLKNDSPAVRYRAVHCLTNQNILRQLTTGSDTAIISAQTIADRFKDVVEQCSSNTLGLMADFAARVDIDASGELLLRIADKRIKKYAEWTVENEHVDIVILPALCTKMIAQNNQSGDFGRRFGQLFSYAIQRYVKGKNFLNDEQNRRLASLLAESEARCISNILAQPQNTIRQAIAQKAYKTLERERSRLFGDETKAGELAVKFGFNYGTNPDGSERTAPPILSQPPQVKADE